MRRGDSERANDLPAQTSSGPATGAASRRRAVAPSTTRSPLAHKAEAAEAARGAGGQAAPPGTRAVLSPRTRNRRRAGRRSSSRRALSVAGTWTDGVEQRSSPAAATQPPKPSRGTDPRRRRVRERQPGGRFGQRRKRHRYRLPARRTTASSRTTTSSAAPTASRCDSGPDGNSIDGKVRGTDPSSDLALLEIDSGQGAGRREAAATRRLRRRPGR